MYPHVTLATGAPAIIYYLTGCFIRLIYMIQQEVILHPFTEWLEVLIGDIYGPVCHVLFRDLNAITLEFLFHTVVWH